MERLAIIGVGLIGGSLARALRAQGSVGEIVGYGRTLENLSEAVRLGVIDGAENSASAAVRGSDMVVVAVPIGSMGQVLGEIRDALSPTAVVTDVGSVKAPVVTDARAALGTRFRDFVPGHPIAGTERSGVTASFAELFARRRVILTPNPDTDLAAVAQVRAMWTAAGADVKTMTAAEHDHVLAASSHLPHALAYALVDMFVRLDEHRAIFDCAGGGFRDFTRIAASDPTMWRDIFLANRVELLALLGQYQDDLRGLAEAIERGDSQWLWDTCARAQRAREQLGAVDESGGD
ncbi:MAG: prephenate dehydrogenase [Candidatus Muproteobacteria bacterium RBG_16_60_9]|uniref:prephenate dehydrogenase n=1 Tax=Candidatus Muproteobacteria bacterium RBG_16_60_9 TaxID=1817755 RepID=A0A1F6V8E1_9PROT|nr:MAG: prephenate dehydrogenase [Candidatus Muproteobacteria bacterium RBG_16_60_9]